MNKTIDDELTNRTDDFIVEKNQPSKRNKRWYIVAIVLFVLLVIAGILYYLEYNSLKSSNDKANSLSDKNSSLTDSNKKLNSQLGTTNSKLSALQSQYDTLKSSVTDSDSSTIDSGAQPIVDQSALTLAINSVQYVNPAGSVTSGGTYLGVRLKITNTTSADVVVDPGFFRVMDAQSNVYNSFGFGGATGFPDGWGTNTFQAQTIGVGKSVTGNLTFMMANNKLTSFTLVNLSKSYPMNLDQ